MSASGIAIARITPSRLLVVLVALLAASALWFIQDRARVYLNYDAKSYADMWPRRGGLIPHMAGGLVALSVGLFQLWLGLTGRTTSLHRTLGRVYLGGVAVGSAGGFYLALTIEPKYFAYAVGLFMLSTAWVLTTAMAYAAIRRGAQQLHREWMIRSYTVTFAFVTFRLIEKLILPWHIAADDEIDTMMAWACWSVPLLFVEPLLQWRRLRRGATG
jgi:uncharacterized membrane protein